MKTREQIALQATDDLAAGCNCAQAVLRQYCQNYGLPTELAMRIASGFGGGMRMGRTCGAISGGIMVLGLAYGFDQIADEAGKQKIEEIVGSYVRNLQAILGTCDCNELLGIDVTQPQIRKQAKADGLFREKCPGFIEAVINELERLLPQS